MHELGRNPATGHAKGLSFVEALCLGYLLGLHHLFVRILYNFPNLQTAIPDSRKRAA